MDVCFVCIPGWAFLRSLTHPWHLSLLASFTFASRPILTICTDSLVSLPFPLPLPLAEILCMYRIGSNKYPMVTEQNSHQLFGFLGPPMTTTTLAFLHSAKVLILYLLPHYLQTIVLHNCHLYTDDSHIFYRTPISTASWVFPAKYRNLLSLLEKDK